MLAMKKYHQQLTYLPHHCLGLIVGQECVLGGAI